MAQNYTEDCFAAGNAGQTDLHNMENNFHCLKTNFSGSSAPSDSTAGMLWADTGNKILKMRGSASDAWVSLIDFSTHTTNSGSVYRLQRTVTAGTGLSGGGQLTTNITINVASSGIDSAQLKDKSVTQSKLSGVASLIGSGAGKVMAHIGATYSTVPTAVIPFVCPTGPSTIAVSISLLNPSTQHDARGRFTVINSTGGSVLGNSATAVLANTDRPFASTLSLSGTALTPGTLYQLAVYVYGGAASSECYFTGIHAYWG